MSAFSWRDFQEDPQRAVPEIGEFLNDGALSLYVGAGASSGFGLPEWKILIARILGKDRDASLLARLDGGSPMELSKLLDSVDDGSLKYVSSVHQALYRDVEKDLLDQLQRSPLLLAVAALITGSCRGNVSSVVTYNYDDLLEQYLAMLGYSVCRRTQPDDLSTRADVELNYVNGYLDQRWSRTAPAPTIVLSARSMRAVRAEIDEGWSEMVVNGLHSKIGLFVGLSGDDNNILDVLERAKKKIKRGQGYNGYWLLTPDAFDRNGGQIADVGACPIRLRKEEIPNFIFMICQAAAAKMGAVVLPATATP